MLVWLLVILSAEAGPRATLGAAGNEAEIEVPLLRGVGDPRPRVEVRLSETSPPLQGVLDLGGDTVRVGVLLAIRRGLRFTHGGSRVALDRLRIGELVVDGAPTQVVSGDELVLGAGALGVGVAIVSWRGAVRFSAAPDPLGTPARWLALDRAPPGPWFERGIPRDSRVHAAVAVRIDGEPALLRLRTDLARSVLSRDGAVEQRRAGGVARAATVELGGEPIGTPWWSVDERVADPRRAVAGELAADALAAFDLSVDPAGGRLAVRPARHPVWSDAAEHALALTEAEAERWPRPALHSDDLLGRSRWERLAALRFATGDTAGAAEADGWLGLVAAEDCEAWLAIGVRQLRSGLDPRAAFDRAVALYAAWAGRTVAERGRASRAVPAACERAIGLRALVGGAPTPIDRLDPGTALAVGRISALRSALGRGGRGDLGLRTALAAAQRDAGAWEPALAWTLEVARSDDPHPLTTAWVLGPELVAAALDDEPAWLAGRLLLASARSVPADDALVRAADEGWVRRPGDPAARCARALAEALAATVDEARPAVPGLPEADCLTAQLLLAVFLGRDPSEADAALRARWPDLVR